MNCTKCHSDNPEGMMYCGQCGEKLEKICPKCNFVNPPQFKFCGRCGNDLTLTSEPLRKDLSPDEKLEKIQKYFPQGIMDKILSQGDKIDGERRNVTVLFADVSSFTAMSETMDPEEVTGIMNKCFSMIGECIEKHGGTIDKFMGDCVMALFGAPIALEDAPQRAIRSAIMIHKEMTQFNDRMKHEKECFIPLRMRIGINTGPVVAGMVGSDGKQDFTVMGNTVNLASRMGSLAEPGSTYVTKDTLKLTEGFFRFEALGEKQVKGKKEAVQAYRVIAPSTRRTRFDVSAEQGLTHFVGREKELELLLDGFERSREGRGQAISIVAEAGIGKSRLLYEFRKAVTNENVTFLEGRCLSYSRNSAYHPIVDFLKANFEIQDTDTDQEKRDKVINGLKNIHVDEVSALPYLLELLSVKDSGFNKIPLSPEAKKYRINETMKTIVLKGSEIRPLIMATEDLHWMDRSSEDAMKEILESIAGARVFLIFTYRSEFIHTWGSRSYHSQITLNRLSNRESISMIEHVLGARNIDRELIDLILEKTEGIPFFVEEFIKSLKDLKIIESRDKTFRLSSDIQKLIIPTTIQDVIMSRVDALPEGAKEVLRSGSVIEREFDYDLIKRVTGLTEKELLPHLSMLKDSELLYERGIYPQSTYIFRHALTREVVYDSILAKKRKQIHEKIAHTMEDIYQDDVCYHYGVLAGHCIAGEDYEKGAEYARLEAKRYQKSGLFKDAIEYAKKRITCLERLPQTEHVQKKIIDARVVLSGYYLSQNYPLLAKETVEPIVDLAVGLDYQKRLPGIYMAMGIYYTQVEEDFSKGIPYLKDAFDISSKVGALFELTMGNYQLGATLPHDFRFEESMKHLQVSLDMAVMANNLIGVSYSKSSIAMNYDIQGKIDLALQECSEAMEAAMKSGDIYAMEGAYTSFGVALYYKGRFDEAEKYLLEEIVYHDKLAVAAQGAWAAAHLGWLYSDTGSYDKAQKYHQLGAKILGDAMFFPSWINCSNLLVELNRILGGETDIDLHHLDEMINAHGKNRLALCRWMEMHCIGKIFLHLDDLHMAEAETLIRSSIDFAAEHSVPWYLGKGHALYADWFKKKGDMRGAREQLSKAIDCFRECGADGWMTRTEIDLATIS
jgi:class 3 adenylate cyclase/tetratricopeptide (TPR) repeat protein